MEEAELLKERLQAITDKRKIQEEISQKRLKVEEEKLKHQHLKKKALREKWLLDGVSSGEEQEEMRRQNQQDQHQIRVLEQSILSHPEPRTENTGSSPDSPAAFRDSIPAYLPSPLFFHTEEALLIISPEPQVGIGLGTLAQDDEGRDHQATLGVKTTRFTKEVLEVTLFPQQISTGKKDVDNGKHYRSFFRLESEIQDLEKAELRISTNEEEILKKLKSIERTTEDIIRSVKVEKEETSRESIEDIYANIPDLPKPYVPSRLRKERNDGIEDDEQDRKALYAMEIKVKKDLKTGESTVLSSVPLPSDDFRGPGIKVYDDGQKSVYAVSCDLQAAVNGTDGLAPVEVEELLRQASERNSRSPTEYHEPVYANAFYRPPAPQRARATPGPNFADRIMTKVNGLGDDRGAAVHPVDSRLSGDRGNSSDHISPVQPLPHPRSVAQRAQETPRSPQRRLASPQEEVDGTPDQGAPAPKARQRPGEVLAGGSEHQGLSTAYQEDEEDVRYNIVHSLPPDMDGAEPVTMIFMGYQQAEDDEEEKRLLSGYDGLIHAELVVIDEEEEEGGAGEEKALPQPPAPHSQGYGPTKPTPLPRKRMEVHPRENTHPAPPHRNSTTLQAREDSLGSPAHPPPQGTPAAGDGTEDPSLTALRMRMAKLGKKVI